MPWPGNLEKRKKIIQEAKNEYGYESPFTDYDELLKNNYLFDKFSFKGQDKLNLGINNIDWENLENIFKEYVDEWNPSQEREKTKYTLHAEINLSYPNIDAFVLYAFIRHYKPKRIIEIGSGQSTRVMIEALLKNDNNCELTCIEPYTDLNYLKEVYPLNIIKDKVEVVDINLFKTLGKDDILFIDSSHVFKPYGDIEYEYLHILPNLRPGVLVHIHDIHYPYGYPRVWETKWMSILTEQQFLIAFLYGNKYWKCICPNTYITQQKMYLFQNKLKNTGTGSFWIERLDD